MSIAVSLEIDFARLERVTRRAMWSMDFQPTERAVFDFILTASYGAGELEVEIPKQSSIAPHYTSDKAQISKALKRLTTGRHAVIEVRRELKMLKGNKPAVVPKREKYTFFYKIRQPISHWLRDGRRGYAIDESQLEAVEAELREINRGLGRVLFPEVSLADSLLAVKYPASSEKGQGKPLAAARATDAGADEPTTRSSQEGAGQAAGIDWAARMRAVADGREQFPEVMSPGSSAGGEVVHPAANSPATSRERFSSCKEVGKLTTFCPAPASTEAVADTKSWQIDNQPGASTSSGAVQEKKSCQNDNRSVVDLPTVGNLTTDLPPDLRTKSAAVPRARDALQHCCTGNAAKSISGTALQKCIEAPKRKLSAVEWHLLDRMQAVSGESHAKYRGFWINLLRKGHYDAINDIVGHVEDRLRVKGDVTNPGGLMRLIWHQDYAGKVRS